MQVKINCIIQLAIISREIYYFWILKIELIKFTN